MNSHALYRFRTAQLEDCRRFYVVGDLHGDSETLFRILDVVDIRQDLLLFIGDYADRGPDSLGTVETVDRLLQQCPERVVGLRGNHENYSSDGQPQFSPCHLMEEVREKRGNWDLYFAESYERFLGRLYLAAMIPGKILFIHGGLSTQIDSLQTLANPSDDLIINILNSDATERFSEEQHNRMRGAALRFGPKVTENVCRKLGVKWVIRGHQHDLARKQPGLMHDRRLVTVISSRVYSRWPYIVRFDPSRPAQLEQLSVLSGATTSIDLGAAESERIVHQLGSRRFGVQSRRR